MSKYGVYLFIYSPGVKFLPYNNFCFYMRGKLIDYQCVNRSDFKPGSGPVSCNKYLNYTILNPRVWTHVSSSVTRLVLVTFSGAQHVYRLTFCCLITSHTLSSIFQLQLFWLVAPTTWLISDRLLYRTKTITQTITWYEMKWCKTHEWIQELRRNEDGSNGEKDTMEWHTTPCTTIRWHSQDDRPVNKT